MLELPILVHTQVFACAPQVWRDVVGGQQLPVVRARRPTTCFSHSLTRLTPMRVRHYSRTPEATVN
jgi:hypothetical protein